MPWKETNAMEQREMFIKAWLSLRHTLSEYRASLAQTSYQENRKKCKAEPKLKQEVYRQLVQTKVLNEGWSPEQLSHRLTLEKSDLSISHNTIYRAIYQGWFDVGKHKAS